MTHTATAAVLNPRFERLAARECISDAQKAAEQMDYATSKNIQLATLDDCLVWAQFSGKKIVRFLPVFPETMVKNPDKRAHPFSNEVGDYFLHENKLFYYDAERKTIAHIAVLYSSDMAKEKIRLKNDDFMPKGWQLVRATTAKGKSFYAWVIYDTWGRSEFLPVFEQDYKKMADANGKPLPKRDFSLIFLNRGQEILHNGKNYSVSYGASRTFLIYN